MKDRTEEQLDMIEDTAAGEMSADQAAFLKSLEAEETAADFDPQQAEAEQKAEENQAEVDAQTAQMTAMGGLAMIEFALKNLVHEEFEFTPDTKAYAIENLSPVLIKYGALLPSWLDAYEAEIKAALAVGKLLKEGVGTTKTLRAKDAAEEADETKKDKERVRVAA